MLQRGALNTSCGDKPLELLKLGSRTDQRGGDASLLPLQQLLALDDHERPVEVANLRSEPRAAHVLKIADELRPPCAPSAAR
jgi:hypothetical protein